LKLIGVYDYTVILTYLSLASAVSGMVLAQKEMFTLAVMCVFISGFLDAFDGIVARTKKNRTEDEKNFGIQLDSLVDVIAFGVTPGVICYFIGVNGFVGIALEFLLAMCAVCRLAFFNALEMNRQKQEGGGIAKYYRGLPVTSISIIMPIVYISKFFVPENAFIVILHIMLGLTAFLFVLDIKVKKPDWLKILRLKK